MALDVLFTLAISSDRETTTLTDATVYGGANPARNTLRVFMSLQKMDVDSVGTVVALTASPNDPETVTSWSWTTQPDGWLKFYYVAIPAYGVGTTYAIYDAVYDSATDLVYRSLSNGNLGNALSNVTFWEPISDPAALANNEGEANESLNITSLIYQRVLTFNSQYEYAVLIGGNCACTDCDDDEIIPPYNLFSLLLNGAIKADQWSEFVKGEQICRTIQSKFFAC